MITPTTRWQLTLFLLPRGRLNLYSDGICLRNVSQLSGWVPVILCVSCYGGVCVCDPGCYFMAQWLLGWASCFFTCSRVCLLMQPIYPAAFNYHYFSSGERETGIKNLFNLDPGFALIKFRSYWCFLFVLLLLLQVELYGVPKSFLSFFFWLGQSVLIFTVVCTQAT